jgi:hypothetical protein
MNVLLDKMPHSKAGKEGKDLQLASDSLVVAFQQFHILLIEVLVAKNVDRIRPKLI